MLQQISRYGDLARQHKGEYNYIEMLGERVEIAAQTAQALFDRVTSLLMPGDPALPPESPFKVVQPPTPGVAAVGKAIEDAASATGPRVPLPAPVPVPAPGTIPPEIKILNPNGPRELILLVDDEVEFSETTSQMLADEGYRVIWSKDGFEAIKICQQIGDQIGLVILDFFLPVMDGDAVFDELHSLARTSTSCSAADSRNRPRLAPCSSKGCAPSCPSPTRATASSIRFVRFWTRRSPAKR